MKVNQEILEKIKLLQESGIKNKAIKDLLQLSDSTLHRAKMANYKISNYKSNRKKQDLKLEELDLPTWNEIYHNEVMQKLDEISIRLEVLEKSNKIKKGSWWKKD